MWRPGAARPLCHESTKTMDSRRVRIRKGSNHSEMTYSRLHVAVTIRRPSSRDRYVRDCCGFPPTRIPCARSALFGTQNTFSTLHLAVESDGVVVWVLLWRVSQTLYVSSEGWRWNPLNHENENDSLQFSSLYACSMIRWRYRADLIAHIHVTIPLAAQTLSLIPVRLFHSPNRSRPGRLSR
jgi:hypothetical protein